MPPTRPPLHPKSLSVSAARYLLQLRDAQTSFQGFTRLIHPDWEIPPFHADLASRLNAFENDHLASNNLLVTMPPRHSKSHYCTVLFPAYFMARDPRRFTMSCSYNAALATGFGREVRDIVEDKRLQQAFPDFNLHGKSSAVDEWRTELGGAYYALGIGGTTSGRPANLLILDDPIKAREDAESMLQRNRTWSYYTSALATRLQPTHDNRPPKQIIILTRWHPDDVAGRLMQTEDWRDGLWHHINYQAITEKITTSEETRDGKPTTIQTVTETPLWPERFPLEELKRRQRLAPHDFSALYQQEPTILGGNMIRTTWWRTFNTENQDEVPGSPTGPIIHTLIIAVDTAFKKTETADYSVAMILAMDDVGDIYILDILRRRLDYPELRTNLITLNNRWRGKGLRAFYVEDKASGQSIIQDLRRTTGMAVIPYSVKSDKVSRVQSILPLIEGGRVHIPSAAPWLDDFMEECQSFPNGRNDDQIDALSMGLDILSRTAISPELAALHIDAGQSLNAMMGNQTNQPNRDSNRDSNRDPLAPRDPVRDSAFGKSLSAALKSSKWNGWGV